MRRTVNVGYISNFLIEIRERSGSIAQNHLPIKGHISTLYITFDQEFYLAVQSMQHIQSQTPIQLMSAMFPLLLQD